MLKKKEQPSPIVLVTHIDFPGEEENGPIRTTHQNFKDIDLTEPFHVLLDTNINEEVAKPEEPEKPREPSS